MLGSDHGKSLIAKESIPKIAMISGLNAHFPGKNCRSKLIPSAVGLIQVRYQ
jgi:hypothetical protein